MVLFVGTHLYSQLLTFCLSGSQFYFPFGCLGRLITYNLNDLCSKTVV